MNKVGKYGDNFIVYAYNVNGDVYMWEAYGVNHLDDCYVMARELNLLCEKMDYLENKYAYRKESLAC